MLRSQDVLARFGLSYQPGDPLPVEIPNAGRLDLAAWLSEWGAVRGAEVGVFGADYSEHLLNSNPKLYLWCVDAWTPYEGYPDYARQSTLDKAKAIALTRLAPHYGRCALLEKFSVEAAETFSDGVLDFVYIDANHDFAHVTEDITIWSRKVKPGGIVAGHDYRRKRPTMKVVEAVHAYTQKHRIAPWFVIGSKAIVPGQVRDLNRSWMWVKP